MSKVSRSKPAARAHKPAKAHKAKGTGGNKAGKAAGKGNAAKVRGTKGADRVQVTEKSGKVHVTADKFEASQKKLDAAKTIHVRTRRGADQVDVAGVKSGNQKVKLKTGLGKDFVRLNDSDGVQVRTGRGNDELEDRDSRRLDIRTGRGKDQARLTGTQDSTLRMGKGRDHARLTDVNDVRVVGARNHVYTTETANRRGDDKPSDAALAAREKVDAKIDAQREKGNVRASLNAQGKLNVRGGKGRDNVSLEQKDGRVIVRSGKREIGQFDANAIKSVDVRTGRGKDEVNIRGLDAGKVQVRTGRGKDQVNVVGSKNVDVRSGRGRDQVHMAQNENVSVRAGRGHDLVTDTASRNVLVRGGRGRDQLRMTETLDGRVNGGRGADLATLTDVDNVHTRRTKAHVFTTPRQAEELPKGEEPKAPPTTVDPPKSEVVTAPPTQTPEIPPGTPRAQVPDSALPDCDLPSREITPRPEEQDCASESDAPPQQDYRASFFGGSFQVTSRGAFGALGQFTGLQAPFCYAPRKDPYQDCMNAGFGVQKLVFSFLQIDIQAGRAQTRGQDAIPAFP